MNIQTGIYNVMNFGALGDGSAKDTGPIQAAIDTCSKNGGGIVYFPNGNYLTGTIYMKSNVTVYLEVSAVIMGSSDIEDYTSDTFYNRYDNESNMDRCLIYSEGVENISFSGPGCIDGQGGLFEVDSPRPMLMRFFKCKNIRLKDLRLRNPASWTTSFILCDTVYAESLDILSRANLNGDGLDFDSCQNIFISNCKFDTSDDSICLQNGERDHPCKNVVVQNCIMKSHWAAVRIGMLSSGDFENVTFSNCVFQDTKCSGFKIQSVEGGRIRNMLFQNIIMRNVVRPIFITLNHFHMGVDAPQKPPETGEVSNLVFDKIRVTYDESFEFDPAAGIVIMGTPGHYIQDITLNNFVYTHIGGGDKKLAQTRDLPELVDCRPEASAFNVIPAYGVYSRHVRGLNIHNFKAEFLNSDDRAVVVLDDAKDVELDGLSAIAAENTDELISFQNVYGAFIHGCRTLTQVKSFIKIEGQECGEIYISGNDLGKAACEVSYGNGTNEQMVKMR